MRLQLGETESQNARQVLETSIQRVHSIAAVHEVLSERGFSMVDLKEVLERLVHLVSGTMTDPTKQVIISVKGESLILPSRSATNLALIVNELVQNALEHAFPDMREGSIAITLATAPDDLIVSVRDNGQGIPAQNAPGLGTEIIRTLVEEELKGRLVYESGLGGTLAMIYLPRESATVSG
jgi:two-component sensor histidine kinase